MGADAKHMMLVALAVTDQASYARYREAIAPMLAACGGDFGCDLVVSEVLRGVDDARANRVFTIGFPDRATKDRFFADERYRAANAKFFAPAVASMQVLAEFTLEENRAPERQASASQGDPPTRVR